MLSAQVYDVIDATAAALQAAAPASAEAARRAGALVRFGDAMRQESGVLKRFLFQNLYRHPQVMQTTGQARQVVRELFAAYCAAPEEMRGGFGARARACAPGGPHDRPERVVADYVSGMTDRFAVREHERLTGRQIFP